MGQSQSSPSPSSPVRETTASYDDLQRAAPASSSGVTLAPELEDDIIRDFQNHLVQAEWNAFRAGLLDRRNERMSNARTALAQKQAQWNDEKQRRDFKMAQLDAILDEAAAKVTDTTVALSHDIRVLERKVQEAERPPSSSSVGGGTGRVVPCLGPRAHWVDCAHKYEFDPRPCDAYLAALERCVQDAVVGQVIRSTSTSTKQ